MDQINKNFESLKQVELSSQVFETLEKELKFEKSKKMEIEAELAKLGAIFEKRNEELKQIKQKNVQKDKLIDEMSITVNYHREVAKKFEEERNELMEELKKLKKEYDLKDNLTEMEMTKMENELTQYRMKNASNLTSPNHLLR
ncbi:unnamed protein product [Moneuplotes crassus]|uniref:Uncharacterized protein n=1 Tax=Euplotes crassus TaxID=5936 RepID=A0AAD2D9H5_EUPCR|nr:unnamed protein product [Moneuplotes crassus]